MNLMDLEVIYLTKQLTNPITPIETCSFYTYLLFLLRVDNRMVGLKKQIRVKHEFGHFGA